MSSTGGCGAPAWAGWSATVRPSWRITRCWPPGCSRSISWAPSNVARRGHWPARYGPAALRRSAAPRPLVRHRRRCRTAYATTRRSADGATPSGASSITEALLTAAHLVDGDRAERYLQGGRRTLDAHSVLLARAPRSAGHWLAVAEAAVRGPLQIAVACDRAVAAAGRCPPAGTRRGDRRRRRGRLVGAVCGPGPDGRCRRRLRVPRSGLRSAGHHARGTRCRSWSAQCSVRPMPMPPKGPSDHRHGQPLHRASRHRQCRRSGRLLRRRRHASRIRLAARSISAPAHQRFLLGGDGLQREAELVSLRVARSTRPRFTFG